MRQTPAQIIETKGGSAVVAKTLGMKDGTVRLWKYRNRIPRSVWPDMLKAYPDLTLDSLMAAERRAA